VQVINLDNNLTGELSDILCYKDDRLLTRKETHTPVTRSSGARRAFGKKDDDFNNDFKDHTFL